MGYTDHARVTRVTDYRTHSWRYINDKAIVLNTHDSDSCMVPFNAPCRALSEVQAIVAQKLGSALTPHDKFLVRTYGTLTTTGYSASCLTDNIYELKQAVKK